MLRFAFAALLLTWTQSGAAVASEGLEVRGTWITTTANSAMATPAATSETMYRLREIGFNTVYVEAWKTAMRSFHPMYCNRRSA